MMLPLSRHTLPYYDDASRAFSITDKMLLEARELRMREYAGATPRATIWLRARMRRCRRVDATIRC